MDGVVSQGTMVCYRKEMTPITLNDKLLNI